MTGPAVDAAGAVTGGVAGAVAGAWARVEGWLAAHAPEVAGTLAGGADAPTLAALGVAIGRPLPDDVRASLARHDGQHAPHPTSREFLPGALLGVDLLSSAQVLATWQGWRDQDARPGLAARVSSVPAGYVRPVYTHPGWIPLTHDGGGNHVGVDLAPGARGQVGQVIVFGRDEETRRVAAPSWAAFLAWAADQLESGNVVLDPDEGFAFQRPPALHLHEAIAGGAA